jgi:cell division protein ZapA
MSANPVAVHLLDKEYLVACSADERPGLLAAAALLDSKMRDVRQAARSAALDRIAVLAALNLAHELLAMRTTTSTEDSAVHQEVQRIRNKLDSAMQTLLVR